MKCIVKKPLEDFGHFSALPLPLYWKFHWPVDSMGEHSLDERKRNNHRGIYWVGQQVCLGFSVTPYWKSQTNLQANSKHM